MKINKNKWVEKLVTVVFILTYVVMTLFHEPWFDEAEAWQIAKCASYRDILFTIPHYEGHPPLWHLILSIPAKLDIPYELGLKSIGLIISTCSVGLLEFKAPFPRWIKVLMPFTYFWFYQYGIIVRPYSLLILFVILSSITFKDKNKRPFRFCGCLMLLCLSSAYGILIAGGIAFAWLVDIIHELGILGVIKKNFHDRRICALGLLLIGALILLVELMPYGDAYAMNSKGGNPVFMRLLCAIFTFICETFLTRSSWFMNEAIPFKYAEINMVSLISGIVIGSIVWGVIWICSKKGHFKYLLMPYILFIIFAVSMYFNTHHIGIVFFILLFWIWTNWEAEGSMCYLEWFQGQLPEVETKKIKRFFPVIILIVMLIPIYWTVSSCILEMRTEYSFGRNISNYIKENQLENMLIVSRWEEECDENGKIIYLDTNDVDIPTTFLPYFHSNIVANMNNGRDDMAYLTHRVASDEENKENLAKWKELGIPDVLIGDVDVELMTDGAVTMEDYIPVHEFGIHYIWRGETSDSIGYIYLRKSVAEQLKIPRILKNSELIITDEMKEKIKNGEDAEEVLKPELDRLFGEENK